MTHQFILIIVVLSFILFSKLTAFQISSSSSTCAVTDKENKVTRIICPSTSIISNIHFASYGNPEGVCGNYTLGSCHAKQSLNIVMNECLNKNKCSFIPSNDVFSLPVDDCHDLVIKKLLYVEVSCKAISSNVSISSLISDIQAPISSSLTTATSSVCMIGWVFYNNKCYHLNIATGVIWTQCESICSGLGASMLCIPDSTTNTWIRNQLNQLSSSYTFIGYSDLPNQDGTYQWINGCSSTYTNWGSYNSYNGYASMYKYDGKWYNYGSSTCSCEYSIAPTASPTVYQTVPTSYPSTVPSSAVPSTISPTVGCQVGWSYYNANCYKFNVGAFFSWSGCLSVCASLGATMLCIPDSTTNNWIASQISQQGYSYSWIGYSDLPNNDGNYEWVSGCSSLYTKYINYGSNGCAYVYAYDGAWYSSGDSGSSSIACSCEYSLSPTSLPTLSPTSPTVNPTPIPTTEPSSAPSTISPTVVCQVGWSYYNNNCYNFNVGYYYSWSDCKSECASLGASMLCIPDSVTNNWIASQLSQQGYYNSWIGYSDLALNNGNYKWVSGCSSLYTNSAYRNNYYYYDCVLIQANNGAWYSTDDSGSSFYACSCEYSIEPTSLPTLLPTSPTVNPTPIPTTIPSFSPSTISPTVGCQVGWSYNNNNCYKFTVGDYFSWSGCKSQCASLGASMLCIPDSTTNSWIANQISQQGSYSSSFSWIGYSDLPNQDGNYKWVSGCSSSYTKYINYGRDCAYIYAYGGSWYSDSDSGSSSIACSCEYSLSPTLLPSLSPTSPTVNPTPIPTTEPSSAPSTISPTVGCQVGWSYYNNNCYKFNVGAYYSWSGCKSQCAALGASMLCIPDSTTNNWIASQISQQGSYYSWIGYSDLPNIDGNYEWVSGCSSSYTSSLIYYDGYYAAIRRGGYWYSYRDSVSSAIDCSCEYPIAPTSLPTLSSKSPQTSIPTLPTISPTVGCQVGWLYYNENCYKFNFEAYFSWSGCKSQCASLGASMLCIPDSTTNNWIARKISLWSWIGYSDLPKDDGNYEWVPGCSSSYSNGVFSSGNNYYESDSVYISFKGVWDIAGDSSSLSCSCEYSLSPTSLPTLSPSTLSGDNTKASPIIGIVVGCVVFVILLILIIMYFFCRRTNQVCISTIHESPSNNDNDISSSNQAYTDVPPTSPYPPSDDDDDIDDENNDNNGVVISSSTLELQVVVATDAYYNDDVPIDHEKEFIPIAVQV